MRQSEVIVETLVVAPVPAAAESLDPLSLLLAWYFISEVIRNKQLHQSGGGAPECARADPKTPPGCQVAADSADTHSVLPHNPSHCTSNEQILVLVKNPTYLLNVSPGRQVQPVSTIWRTQIDIQTKNITDKHTKTFSLLMRIWFHKRDLQTLLAHKSQMVEVSPLTKDCCWQVAVIFLIQITDWTLQIWWNREYQHVFFYFIIQTDIVLMFGNFSLTWKCYFYCFSQQAVSNFQLHHFELTQKLK